ncbi:MAG: FliM/FliN family flagellar motor switch protein [Acidobacteria bacterium]|nr:FliM/FliN family flagellar motor switch protein [Acidobacteriota bacterium]
MAEAAVQEKREVRLDPVEKGFGPFLDLPLRVEIVLGNSTISVAELLNMVPQGVIPIAKAAGDDMDIMVNGQLIGRGAVIIIEDRFGIRITEVVSKICS